MPSTRVPTSIAIGPGQLPDNVGSASSLVHLPASAAPLGSDPEATVILLTLASTTLTRLSSRMIVVADNSADAREVNLPTVAEAGDTVTIVQSTNETGGDKLIQVSALGPAQLNGHSTLETLSGAFGARTFVNTANGSPRWVGISERRVVQTTSDAFYSVTRSGAEQYVLVDNSGGLIGVILPPAQVGDRLTIVNQTTSTNAIMLTTSDGATIDGLASVTIQEIFGAWSFVRVPGDQWVSISKARHSVIVATTNVTVPRGNRVTYVFADTTGGPLTVTLPAEDVPGDRITVIDAGGVANTNAITVTTGAGGDEIMGAVNIDWTINDRFGSLTLARASSAVWSVTQKSSPFLLSVSNTTSSLARRGAEMRVFVDTSAGTWTGSGPQDTIMTPLLPSPGDRFTVVDVGGEADVKHITIVGDGTRVIGETPASGDSQIRIARRFGSITLLFTGSRWVEESTSNINPFVLISDTAVLERYGRDFTVHVNTAAGTWSDTDTITLPSTSTSAMVGDTVTVVDVGGLAGVAADSIRVVASAGTINGVASYLMNTTFGSVTFVYIGSDDWVVTSTSKIPASLDPVLLRLRQIAIDDPFTDADASFAVRRMTSGPLIIVKSGATDVRYISESDDKAGIGGTVTSITSLVSGIAGAGSLLVVTGTGGNRCSFSSDFGATWDPGDDLGATPNFGSIIFNSTHSLLMVGFAAGVNVATHGVTIGSPWASVSSGLTSAQGGIAHFSNGDTLVCGLDGPSNVAFARSTDGGASWGSTATVPNPGDYDDSGWIDGDGGSTIYHAGRVGTVLRVCSTTSSMTWSLLASIQAPGTITFKPRILLCPDTGVLVVVYSLSGGTVVHASRDRGITWSGPAFYRTRFTSSFGIARGRLFSTYDTSLFATDRLV